MRLHAANIYYIKKKKNGQCLSFRVLYFEVHGSAPSPLWQWVWGSGQWGRWHTHGTSTLHTVKSIPITFNTDAGAAGMGTSRDFKGKASFSPVRSDPNKHHPIGCLCTLR